MSLFAAVRMFRRWPWVGLAPFALGVVACGAENPGIPGPGSDGYPLSYSKMISGASEILGSPLSDFGGFYTVLSAPRPDRIFSGNYGRLTQNLGTNRIGFSLSDGFEDVSDLLPEFALGDGFQWKQIGESSSGHPADLVTTRHQLVFRDLPVVGYSLTIQSQSQPMQLSGGASEPKPEWIYGSLPAMLELDPTTHASPAYRVGTFSYSRDQVRRAYASHQGFPVESVSEGRPVFFASGSELFAAYEFTVASSHEPDSTAPAVPLRAYVDADDGQLIEQIPLALHLDGLGRGFRENAVASAQEGLIDLPLTGLSDSSGKLENNLMSIKTCGLQLPSAACAFGASAGDGNYRTISPESASYDEVVAYYSISRAMGWYRSLMDSGPSSFATENVWGSNRTNFGFELPQIGRLTVYVRAMTKIPNAGTTLDNAVYLPGGTSGGGAPEIVIGTGWESGSSATPRALRYIGKDGDVSMHEFGHHIVYRTVSEIKGQALGMHEGFADYFTYAATGNNFLAESVVAIGSYLRAANKSGTLAEYPPTSNTPPHIAGEFWSTVLWDIRASLGPWRNGYFKLDKIAYHAIDLMRSNETYYGAIAALLRSAEIFASAYGDDAVTLKEKILAEFYRRGFIAKPKGDGTLPEASALLTSSTQPTSVAPSAETTQVSQPSRKKSSFLGISCTVGGHSAGVPAADMGTLALLLLIGLVGTPLRWRASKSCARRLELKGQRTIMPE